MFELESVQSYLVDQYGEGLHYDVPGSDYYRKTLGEANKGGLDLISRSPYHYRYWIDQADQGGTEAMNFGRALHCAILEPDLFKANWVTLPDFGPMNSSVNRANAKRYLEMRADKEFITADQSEQLIAMQNAVFKHDTASAYVGAGRSEVTACWRDQNTDLPCKARGDNYIETFDTLIDVKSCLDASPEGFSKVVAKHRYHVQQAHYANGWASCDKPLRHFIFLCIEKDPPYAVAIYPLDAASEERGHVLLDRDMSMLSRCMEADRWPSYNNNQTAELRIPAYAHYD